MRKRSLRVLTLLAALIVVAGACGDSDPASDDGSGLSEADTETVRLNAVNQLGWTDVPPAEWARLSVDACESGAWDTSVADDLAEGFLDDNGLRDRPEADQLSAVIWLNLFVVCPEDVPDGAQPPASLTG
jgi:hypothetical protein